jgi:hypothetical protein
LQIGPRLNFSALDLHCDLWTCVGDWCDWMDQNAHVFLFFKILQKYWILPKSQIFPMWPLINYIVFGAFNWKRGKLTLHVAFNLSLICFNNVFHPINFQTFLFCNYSIKKHKDMTTMSCGCWCTTSQSDSIHDFILSLEPFKYW